DPLWRLVLPRLWRGPVGRTVVDRKSQGEGRSGARHAPQLDIAAMVGGDVFDDRESEARAPGGSRTRLVGAVEPLEDPFLVLLGDADAAVGHGDLDHAVDLPPADRHGAARRRVRDGVLQ